MALSVKDVVGLILAHIGWTKVGPVLGVTTGGSPAVAQQLNFGAIGAAFGLTPAVLNGFLANVSTSLGVDPTAIGNALMKNPITDLVTDAKTAITSIGTDVTAFGGQLATDLKAGLDSVTATANIGLDHTNLQLGITSTSDLINPTDMVSRSAVANLVPTVTSLGVPSTDVSACFGTLYNPGPFQELFNSVAPNIPGGLTEITTKLQDAVTNGLPTEVLKNEFLTECNKLTSSITSQLQKDKDAFAKIVAPIQTATTISSMLPQAGDAIGQQLAKDFGTAALTQLQAQVTSLASTTDNLVADASKTLSTANPVADIIVNRTGAPITGTKTFNT